MELKKQLDRVHKVSKKMLALSEELLLMSKSSDTFGVACAKNVLEHAEEVHCRDATYQFHLLEI